MPYNLPTLLSTAAELRSGGASWDAVGRQVRRSPKTCQQWPKRFRAEWEPLYRDAEQQRFEEANNEALAILRSLLRSGDDKTKMRSAEVLLRIQQHRLAHLPASPALSGAGFDPEALQLAQDVINLEEKYRAKMNPERAAKGLPPVTEQQMTDAIFQEGLDMVKASRQLEERIQESKIRLAAEAAAHEPAPKRDLRGVCFGAMIAFAAAGMILALAGLSQNGFPIPHRNGERLKMAASDLGFRPFPLSGRNYNAVGFAEKFKLPRADHGRAERDVRGMAGGRARRSGPGVENGGVVRREGVAAVDRSPKRATRMMVLEKTALARQITEIKPDFSTRRCYNRFFNWGVNVMTEGNSGRVEVSAPRPTLPLWQKER